MYRVVYSVVYSLQGSGSLYAEVFTIHLGDRAECALDGGTGTAVLGCGVFLSERMLHVMTVIVALCRAHVAL